MRTGTRYLVGSLFALLVGIGTWVLLDPNALQNPFDSGKRFLEDHWKHPLAPQGEPPKTFSALEASLAPRDCGQCHEAQYRDWVSSLHRHTMGAGIQWQFDLMEPAEANRCLRCHAPLAEQKALVARTRGWPNAPEAEPPGYVPGDLAEQGLICAACHVRKHQRYGPPRGQGGGTVETAPHGGFESVPAFEDSRFCAVCHQFPEDGPRLNGKLHEDTYEQWRASVHAREGRTCQSCHMPDRRHLWKGVHDPAMIRQALDAALDVNRLESGVVQVSATLTNKGAGHHFPTYMVPKVTAVLYMVSDRGGQPVRLAQKVIGWHADVHITEERFDTRIPAGGKISFTAPVRLQPEWAGWIELRLKVQPREHYTRVFRYMLDQGEQVPQATRQKIHTALREAEATDFDIVMARTVVGAIAN